jgi:hypothetical protein
LLFRSVIVQNISVASKTKKKEKRGKQKKNCPKRRLFDSAAENQTRENLIKSTRN